MTARLAQRMAAALACAALLAAPARAEDPGAGDARSVERWAAAARSYPDDPDVAWAYALALSEAGRVSDALRQLQVVGARWPERAADAAFEAGSIHWGRGEYSSALRAFEDAIEVDPMRGDARLYRALALQALGRDAEAERELRVLARIAPELAQEALLLQGLDRARRRDRAASVDLLSQVVSLDPKSESAAAARSALALLGTGPSGPRVIGWATVGGESDSNVILDGGTVPPSDRADIGLVFGGGLAGSLYRSDRVDLSLGYAYNGSLYHDLKTHDLAAHSLIASFAWATPARVVLRLDGSVLDGELGGSPYLQSALLRPNLVIPFSESSATLRLFAEIERRNYRDDPPISSLDRDGSTYGVGLEQTLPLSFWEGAYGSIRARIGRTNTLASRDLLGFEGDFDARHGEIAGELYAPLGSSCDARLGGTWTRDRYVNANLIDALTDDGVGTSNPRRRDDSTLNGVVALGCRPLPDWRVEARWFGTLDRSNVDVYDYRRNVVGLYLTRELHWP